MSHMIYTSLYIQSITLYKLFSHQSLGELPSYSVYMFVYVHLCVLAWCSCGSGWASTSCSVTQMLPPCLLVPLWASCHHRDEIRTEQCRRVSLHSLCWSLVEKGDLQQRSLWRRFWIAVVQNPVCLQSRAQWLLMYVCFKALMRSECESGVRTIFLSNHSMCFFLGRRAHLFFRGKCVNLLCFSFPTTLRCCKRSLILLHRFGLKSQFFPTSTWVCSTTTQILSFQSWY